MMSISEHNYNDSGVKDIFVMKIYSVKIFYERQIKY